MVFRRFASFITAAEQLGIAARIAAADGYRLVVAMIRLETDAHRAIFMMKAVIELHFDDASRRSLRFLERPAAVMTALSALPDSDVDGIGIDIVRLVSMYKSYVDRSQ